jgi:hypothetical protein
VSRRVSSDPGFGKPVRRAAPPGPPPRFQTKPAGHQHG